MPLGGEQHVVEHRHAREHARRLVRPHDPGPRDAEGGVPVDAFAGVDDPAAIGLERSGDGREQRRLARAVRPDQASDRVLGDVERRPVHRAHAAERADDALDLEERAHSSTISRLLPSRPCGRTTTSTMMIRPMMISRRYARWSEPNHVNGAKLRKRVPAKMKPNTPAPTGTAHTRPRPPSSRIIHAKNVSSGSKSSGLKNENSQA